MIREAGAADAQAIAHVHIASWRAAYAEILPPDALPSDAELPARRAAWRELLEGSDERERTWVGLLDGAVVGFASAGPSRDEDADPQAVGELRAIYLLEHVWRRGLGRALNAAAERFLSEAGLGEATLWVLAANAPARRFYETAGWGPDGAKRSTCAGVPAPSFRYRRRLASGR